MTSTANITKVAPKSRACSCRVNGGLFKCSRYAVVRVGMVYYCKQHATVRGIAIPHD